MITETTRRVLWRKFKEATDKVDFLQYVSTVCHNLRREMSTHIQGGFIDYKKEYELKFKRR